MIEMLSAGIGEYDLLAEVLGLEPEDIRASLANGAAQLGYCALAA